MTYVPWYLEFFFFNLEESSMFFGIWIIVFIDKLYIFIILYQFLDEIKIIIFKKSLLYLYSHYKFG